MSFQIAYLSPTLTKQFSLALTVIAGVIYVLSDKGQHEVIASEPFLSARTGIAIRTISKIKKVLEKEGYLKISTKNYGFSRSTTLIPTQKLSQVFDFSDNAQHALSIAHDIHYRSCTKDVTIKHSMRDQSRTGCVSDNAQHAFINNIENNTQNNNVRSVVDSTEESARERTDSIISKMETVNEYDPMDELPPPDDFIPPNYAYNAQDASNSPQMSDYTSETKIAPPERYTNEIEGYRDTSPHQTERTEKAPQTADEIVPLIERFKEAHRNEKVFEKIDVSFYAGKIFDYYVKADGMWRDRNNNPIPAFKIYNKISMWITNDQRSGKLCLIQNKTQQQSVEDSERELRDFANRLEVAAGRMTPEEYRRRSVGNASYTVIDQDSIIDNMPLLATATRSKP